MRVVEIFYSLQGEGANTGKPAVFVRLAGCNLDCSYCDTDWKSGKEMSVEEILLEIKKYPSKMVIWTGGEPTLQLTDEWLSHFSEFYNCIETNGTNSVPSGIDYISCSPKVSVEVLRKNFSKVNEFRFPVKKGYILPDINDLPRADNYFLSPIFEGNDLLQNKKNAENLEFCVNFIKENPTWILSFQSHKFLGFR
ncbi:MAG: 7-carboxy-7-deazaguanine synthase QueE [Prevotellaceae bacterium]|nr:7-carboxy-7-deazaguanine synthase QueE [Prevotellaceae bacterium]